MPVAKLPALATILVLVVSVACKSKREPGRADEPTPPATVDAASATPAPVTVFVDDKQVATVSAAALRARPSLPSLVPQPAYASWRVLEAYGRGKAKLVLVEPATRYAERVPHLYVDAQQRASIGLYPSVAPNASARLRAAVRAAPVFGLHDVHKLVVHTQPLPAAAPPKPARLSLTVAGKSHQLELDRVPKRARRRRGREPGWALRDVLAPYVRVANVVSVTAWSESGGQYVISRAQLTQTSPALSLELNRRGVLQLRAGPAPGQRRSRNLLRNVRRLDVRQR